MRALPDDDSVSGDASPEQDVGELIDRRPETVFQVDSEGRLFSVQEASCRVLGYRPEELAGRPWTTIHTRLSAKDWPRVWNRTRRVGQWIWRTAYRHRNGSEIPVEVTVHFLACPPRECVLAVGRDVTEVLRAEEERRHLEAQILHTQKLESLGILAGGIAHDFNNLLVGILGNTSLAMMKTDPGSSGLRHLVEVEMTARRAAELVGQMLAYSGKADFVVEVLDMNQVIREMTQLLSVSISKRARLHLQLSSEPIRVRGVTTQIRQILMNLITNASEAIGRESGRITVSTGVMPVDRAYLAEACLGTDLPEGTYAYFEVSDTGCGMCPEARAKVFDPFFTTKTSGRGLGMAAVAGILRSHRGAIRLESELGRGSTFRVLVPVSTRKAPLAGEGVGDWQGRGSVLVVDDEQVIRLVARRTLEKAGFDVLLAEDGVEALEIYHRHAEEIVAVLLDIAMPRLDGIETLYELRCRRPDLRVLLSSGFSEQDIVPPFTSRRFSSFLKKPYKPVELVRGIRELLEKISPANDSNRPGAAGA